MQVLTSWVLGHSRVKGKAAAGLGKAGPPSAPRILETRKKGQRLQVERSEQLWPFLSPSPPHRGSAFSGGTVWLVSRGLNAHPSYGGGWRPRDSQAYPGKRSLREEEGVKGFPPGKGEKQHTSAPRSVSPSLLSPDAQDCCTSVTDASPLGRHLSCRL